LLQYIHASQTKLLEGLKQKRALDAEIESALQSALKSFAEIFDSKKKV
jgi:exopolyphosphatase/pppGpp-phosphohydrolase